MVTKKQVLVMAFAALMMSNAQANVSPSSEIAVRQYNNNTQAIVAKVDFGASHTAYSRSGVKAQIGAASSRIADGNRRRFAELNITEPASLALFGLVLLGLGAARSRI